MEIFQSLQSHRIPIYATAMHEKVTSVQEEKFLAQVQTFQFSIWALKYYSASNVRRELKDSPILRAISKISSIASNRSSNKEWTFKAFGSPTTSQEPLLALS